jgi:hypothetical protein
MRDDLAEHVRLAHPPGYQLRVLGTEVDHQDAIGRCCGTAYGV